MPKTVPLPQLPSMECIPGCSDCCGVVPVSRDEFNRAKNAAKARGVKPVPNGIKCPLLIDNRCSIYEARPFICRIFGHGDGHLACPNGAGSPARPEVVKAHEERHLPAIKRAGFLTLHELVYTPEEMAAIVRAEMEAEPC